jgi:hypothetical protein
MSEPGQKAEETIGVGGSDACLSPIKTLYLPVMPSKGLLRRHGGAGTQGLAHSTGAGLHSTKM